MKLLERVAQPIIRAVEKGAREEGRAEERGNLATERESLTRERENMEALGAKFPPDEPQDGESE